MYDIVILSGKPYIYNIKGGGIEKISPSNEHFWKYAQYQENDLKNMIIVATNLNRLLFPGELHFILILGALDMVQDQFEVIYLKFRTSKKSV